MHFICVAVICIVSYLCGAVNGAVVASRIYFNSDIRKYGSKNPGMTNYCRVYGSKGVWLLFFIDVAKTALPMLGSYALFQSLALDVNEAMTCSWFFVTLGHAFPVYYGFHGGKTVLCCAVGMWFLDWRVALICYGIFAVLVISTRYVSLGSCAGAIACPIASAWFGGLSLFTFLIMMIIALFLVWRHKPNIQRLLSGTESKFTFNKKQSPEK